MDIERYYKEFYKDITWDYINSRHGECKETATNYTNVINCDFPPDYSPTMYSPCNNCMFCYAKDGVKHKNKRKPAEFLVYENNINELHKTPITISRYFDPWRTESSRKNCMRYARFVLSNGGKIIFVAPSLNIDNHIFDYLAQKYPGQIQYQIKVFTDDSFIGKNYRVLFAPKFPNLQDHAENIKRLSEAGIKVSIKVDPFILGINDNKIFDGIIKFGNDNGINSFILKPIVAAEPFREKLKLISTRVASLLSNRLYTYWTYPNDVLFDNVSELLLKYCDNNTITFCGNRPLNYILRSHNNCCQFDGAELKYNPNYNMSPRANLPLHCKNRYINGDEFALSDLASRLDIKEVRKKRGRPKKK